MLEEEIQPILVPATLEHEGISGIGELTNQSAGNKSLPYDNGGGQSGDPKQQINPQEALDRMLRLLTRFHAVFSKHCLDPEVISLIFKQLFFFICAGSLNNLLLRKELCHWSKGMQIRYVQDNFQDFLTFGGKIFKTLFFSSGTTLPSWSNGRGIKRSMTTKTRC